MWGALLVLNELESIADERAPAAHGRFDGRLMRKDGRIQVQVDDALVGFHRLNVVDGNVKFLLFGRAGTTAIWIELLEATLTPTRRILALLLLRDELATNLPLDICEMYTRFFDD